MIDMEKLEKDLQGETDDRLLNFFDAYSFQVTSYYRMMTRAREEEERAKYRKCFLEMKRVVRTYRVEILRRMGSGERIVEVEKKVEIAEVVLVDDNGEKTFFKIFKKGSEVNRK